MTRVFDIAFWITPASAFVLSVVATPIIRWIAQRFGIVAKPKIDRWHKKPTPMLGGVGIFLAINATIVAFQHSFSVPILTASALIFAIGLIDDLFRLKPYHKLIGQVVASMIVVHSGLLLPWTSSVVINMAVTFLWLIGITNAVNMLDNMDGLAAGIAVIAAIFLAVNFWSLGQLKEATAIISFAAAMIGFLLYNVNPASIFMGDCGSMFIGFFLASVALLTSTTARTRSFLPVIAVPVLTLLIPIFDTTLVTLLRKLSGRPASQGGRDHTSHRLVALGLSERRAVWLLYGLAVLSGALALKVREWPLHESVAAIAGFTTILAMAGVYLAGVKVYDPDHQISDNRLVSFLVDISYKRRVFETLLDVSLISLAYYGAYLLRFGELINGDPNFKALIRTIPIVVAVKIAIFLAVGVYRGLWRYTSLHDVVNLVKAAILGSLGSIIVIVYAFRFDGFSRGVFILDALLLTVLLTGSRVAFRVARRMLPRPQMRDGRRVLIYGAGDAGELLVRELLNNEKLRYAPVAFLDDDPRKSRKLIHGLRVHAGDSLIRTCELLRAEEIIISSSKVSRVRVQEIVELCDAIGIPVRQMHIQLVSVNAWKTDILLDDTATTATAAALPIRRIGGNGSTNVFETPAVVRPDLNRTT